MMLDPLETNKTIITMLMMMMLFLAVIPPLISLEASRPNPLHGQAAILLPLVEVGLVVVVVCGHHHHPHP